MTPFPENAQSISDGISLEFGYFISLPQICQRSSSIFRDVSFRYLRSEKYALRGVSFKVILGQLCIRPTNAIYSLGPRPVSSSICVVFYAIVGSNESGKSTILKLVVARIYDPTEWRRTSRRLRVRVQARGREILIRVTQQQNINLILATYENGNYLYKL